MKQIRDDSRLLFQMPFYESFATPGSKPASLLSYILSNKGSHSLFSECLDVCSPLLSLSRLTELRCGPRFPEKEGLNHLSGGIPFYNCTWNTSVCRQVQLDS